MARDAGLEDLVRHDLAGEAGLMERRMFGGMAWLLRGNLLCGARTDGMLVRLGAGNDGWALALPDVAPMVMRSRPMRGWLRAGPEAYGDDALRRKLLAAALAFARSLPGKQRSSGAPPRRTCISIQPRPARAAPPPHPPRSVP
jgi:hypothetical protein